MGSEGGAANRIDPAVNAMQPPRGNSGPDRPLTQPELHKLNQGHNPVLAIGQLGDQHVQRVKPQFRHSCCRNCGLTGHGASIPPGAAPFNAAVERLRYETVTSNA